MLSAIRRPSASGRTPSAAFRQGHTQPAVTSIPFRQRDFAPKGDHAVCIILRPRSG